MASSTVHRIRLKGPWEVVAPQQLKEEPAQTVTLPASWDELFGAATGQAVFRRKFHSPTGLTSVDRVRIRIPEQDAGTQIVSVQLNGEALDRGSEDAWRFEITPQLRSFNSLELVFERSGVCGEASQSGIWQAVEIEIHSA